MNTTTSKPAATALLDLDEALDAILSDVRAIAETEPVDISASDGRVLAEPLTATIDVPGFDNSAMDGYALRHADIADDPHRALPVAQRILAGDTPEALGPGEAARIFTGAPLPAGADTVVMQEECERDGDRVRVTRAVSRGEYVRPRGHDFPRGRVLLEAGHRVRPQDLAIAAANGVTTVRVTRRPHLAIFSTGDELALPGEPLHADRRYTANNQLLAALAARAGCRATDAGVVPDNPAATRRALLNLAAEHDLVISSGGASVGEADHVHEALGTVGEIRFWRIAVRPGKPVLFGRIGDAAFVGLPGNPVSCLVTFLLLVRPLALAIQGARYAPPARFYVKAGFDWPRPGSRREFVRARLVGGEDDRPTAVLYTNQSSDVLSSAVWADGLVELPPGTTVCRGQAVRYIPFSGLLDP